MAPLSPGPGQAIGPRHSAPVGAYLTDGAQLLYVLESDWSGVLCENASDELEFVELSRDTLARKWRRVTPRRGEGRA